MPAHESVSSESIIIAIPFYSNADLVEPLLDSLLACGSELQELKAEIFAVVDSPDDAALTEKLSSYQGSFPAGVHYTIHVNHQNIGFIKSMNLAFEKSVQENRDIVILNSDVVVFPGCFREMRRVAYEDHMTAFVSPRSNNATICTLPYADGFRYSSPQESYQRYLRLAAALPQADYVPTVVGFAMYIKRNILTDFGYFDEIYGLGYNEENDLIMRANRCGYRAVIANKAFVYHIGEQSFNLMTDKRTTRELENQKLLHERYPEYPRAVEQFFQSTRFQATRLLDGLTPDAQGRIRIGFDMRSFRKDHNGTFEAAKKIIADFIDRFEDFSVHAICAEDVFRFHALEGIEGLTRIDFDDPIELAAVIRIGQPFSPQDIRWLRLRAPVIAIFMLDTIALDCQHLDTVELEKLWTVTFDAADIILYNSEYTMHQFNSRFQVDESVIQIPILHSTDEAEYHDAEETVASAENGHVLVLGNKFEHKFLKETVELLRKNLPGARLCVFGVDGESDSLCRYVAAGGLSGEEVNALYRDARIVVFPSHYEGFGFPIMNALAHRRPILARQMPVYEEIRARTAYRGNIVFFREKNELLDLLRADEITWNGARADVTPVRWSDTSRALRDGLEQALTIINRERLRKRLERLGQLPGKRSPSALPSIRQFASNLCIFIDRQWQQKRRWLQWNRLETGHERIERELVKQSFFFDEAFYLEANQDVKDARVDAVVHFCRTGWQEGRNPGPFFDLQWYKSENPDVTGMNPLVHYLCHGIFEDRAVRWVTGGDPIVFQIRAEDDGFLSQPAEC